MVLIRTVVTKSSQIYPIPSSAAQAKLISKSPIRIEIYMSSCRYACDKMPTFIINLIVNYKSWPPLLRYRIVTSYICISYIQMPVVIAMLYPSLQVFFEPFPSPLK